jgi:hypothetical protein
LDISQRTGLIQGCTFLVRYLARLTPVLDVWSCLHDYARFFSAVGSGPSQSSPLPSPLQTFASGLGGSELMRLPRLSDSPRSSGNILFIIESSVTHLGTACIFALGMALLLGLNITTVFTGCSWSFDSTRLAFFWDGPSGTVDQVNSRGCVLWLLLASQMGDQVSV